MVSLSLLLLADQWGKTALHLAVRQERVEAAVQLIAAGADVDAKDQVRTLHMLFVFGATGLCWYIVKHPYYLIRTASLQWN